MTGTPNGGITRTLGWSFLLDCLCSSESALPGFSIASSVRCRFRQASSTLKPNKLPPIRSRLPRRLTDNLTLPNNRRRRSKAALRQSDIAWRYSKGHGLALVSRLSQRASSLPLEYPFKPKYLSRTLDTLQL